MRAMTLSRIGPAESSPLTMTEIPRPEPGPRELLVRVEACGVCRTDLHVVEGDLPPVLPGMIPGHEVVGRIEVRGREVERYRVGDRVGIPWLHRSCGRCRFCMTGRENLCPSKEFTGYTTPGGYAEYARADEAFALPLPDGDPGPLAPWLCAGIIGYRALKLASPPPGGRVGLFGFGASAHLTLQLAARLGFETVVYSRSPAHRRLAERLGASEVVEPARAAAPPSGRLDSALVFAPAGEVVLQALGELDRGGSLVIAAIHLTPIPSIDYDRRLFGERRIQSVEANTRTDAREFLSLARRLDLRATTATRPLEAANEAMVDLKQGRIDGAVVLDPRAVRPAGPSMDR
ncbi:MAG: zinc-dependent alcohol dehydrogenase family protein [Thermoplasmata archaeon]